MLILINDRRIMGDYCNGWTLNLISLLTVTVLIVRPGEQPREPRPAAVRRGLSLRARAAVNSSTMRSATISLRRDEDCRGRAGRKNAEFNQPTR